MRHQLTPFLGAVALIVCGSSFAATRSWTGASSANWSDGANWVPAGAPVAGENLFFPNGTLTITNDLPAGFVVNSLTFGAISNATITLNGNALTLIRGIQFTGTESYTGASMSFVCNVPLKVGNASLGDPHPSGPAIWSTYNGAIDVNGSLYIASDYPTTTIAGPVNGSGAIFAGEAGIDLNGNGNFSGTISGTVNLNGAYPNMNKTGAGMLTGTGTLGTVTIPAGDLGRASVAPGPKEPYGAVGTLHTQSLLSLVGYGVDLVPGGTSDSLQVTGTVMLGGRLDVAMPSGAPAVGQTFRIIDNDGADPVSGTFAGLSEGATLVAGPATLSISYHGGDGNDVVLTVVSAPKSWTGANSGLWSDPGNWSPAVIPLPGENLFFPDGSRTTMTNDLPAGFTVGAMTFGAAGNITLSGNALTLMGDIRFTGAAKNFVCNVPLKIGRSVHFYTCCAESIYNGAIDVNGQTLSISGTIAGPLNGSGAIIVLFGLHLNSSGNFSGTISGAVDLNGAYPAMNYIGSSWLVGSGTLGTVTFPPNSGAVVPGPQEGRCCGNVDHTIGTLHTQSLSLAPFYYVDLVPGGTSDSLQVTGSVTLSGSLTVTVPSGVPTPGQSFTIIDNDGTDPVRGTFAGLPEGATISVGTSTLAISYHGGDGNDVVLTAVSAIKAWTGANSELWSDPGNWSPAAIPVFGENLVFPNGSRTTMTNDLPAGFTVGMLRFGASNATTTLNGNALTLMGDVQLIARGMDFICNVPLKIGTTLYLGKTLNFGQNIFIGRGPLPDGANSTYNGAIDVNGQTLHIQSSYNTTIAGSLNGSGAIRIDGGTSDGYPSTWVGGIDLNSSGNFSGTIDGAVNLNGAYPNMNKIWSGTLTGNGTLGTLDIPSAWEAEASVAPGPQELGRGDSHTAGTLHTQSISLGGTYYVDLYPSGMSDSLQVTGTVTLRINAFFDNWLRVTFPAGVPTPGQTFTIIDNDGTDPVNGTFAGAPEGWLIGQPPFLVRISYHGGDGNDVVLTAVAPAFTSLVQSSASSVFGEGVTFRTAVSSEFGPVTGLVTFKDGVVVLGTVPLQGGIATFTTSALAAGGHSITAVYAGNDRFASFSDPFIYHQVQRGTETLSLNASPLLPAYGDSVTFTASLTPVAPSTAAPTGNIVFNSDGHLLETKPLVNGVATLSTTSLSVGTHTITATYAGDANFAASSASAIQQNVGKAHTEVDPRWRTRFVGEPLPITVYVNITPGSSLAPTGSVTLSEESEVLATQPLAGGVASFFLSPLSVGDHTLVASYGGGTDFEASSATFIQSVIAPALSIHGLRVVEGNQGVTTVPLVVTLSAPVSQPVRVSFSTVAGSATEGEDYEKASGVIEFAPGEVSHAIELHVLGDTIPEADETFSVLLSNAVNAAIETPSALVVIANDDQVPPRHRPVRH